MDPNFQPDIQVSKNRSVGLESWGSTSYWSWLLLGEVRFTSSDGIQTDGVWVEGFLDVSGCWFQIFCSSWKLGKWSNLTDIFQMGWNHQVSSSPCNVYSVSSFLGTLMEMMFAATRIFWLLKNKQLLKMMQLMVFPHRLIPFLSIEPNLRLFCLSASRINSIFSLGQLWPFFLRSGGFFRVILLVFFFFQNLCRFCRLVIFWPFFWPRPQRGHPVPVIYIRTSDLVPTKLRPSCSKFTKTQEEYCGNVDIAMQVQCGKECRQLAQLNKECRP